MGRPRLPRGRAVAYPHPFISDSQLKEEDPNQIGAGGSQEGRVRSVYLASCRRDWLASVPGYRLYRVDVASSGSGSGSGSGSDDDSPPGGKIRLCDLPTDVGGGKTFLVLQSRWILGVGGNPGGTVIYDTKDNKVIRGPKLHAAKRCPVVAAVGYKVYALSSRPNFIDDPDFVPWFEVLDLSKATVAQTAGGELTLDRCSWKPLPSPLCFPAKLTPMGYIRPPVLVVRSYVLVRHYMLVSLYPPSSGTYAFDAEKHEWHKVDDEYLPFIGSATPHGHSGSIFLGFSREKGPINAYRIRVSTSSSFSTVAGVSGKGNALKLSITVFPVKTKEHDEICSVTGSCLTSLDRERFSLLTFALDNRKRSRIYNEKRGKFQPGKVRAKLITYGIENPQLLEEEALDEEKLLAAKPEVAISCHQYQAFKVSSSVGFSSPPITFALSI